MDMGDDDMTTSKDIATIRELLETAFEDLTLAGYEQRANELRAALKEET